MYIDNLKELEDLCKVLYTVIKIPVSFILTNGNLLFEFSYGTLNNPISDYRTSILNNIEESKKNDYPFSVSTDLLENFLVLYIEINSSKKGYLIFGPTIAHLHDETINLIEQELTVREKWQLKKYYDLLPSVKYQDLSQLGVFVYFLLYKKKINFNTDETSDISQDLFDKIENEHKLHYLYTGFHTRTPYLERQYYSFIKEGKTEELAELLRIHDLYEEFKVLSKKSPLRSWKNLAICYITIASRAAIEGGLSIEATYALTDVIIQKLEELTTTKNVENFVRKIFFDFTEKVRILKGAQYSKLVTQCKTYISEHLDQSISLSDLAKMYNINTSYLSKIFKEEVGVKISEYILREKINEAKKMLLFTNFSILDIYSSLNFHDQSHFTNVFKKYVGTTPKKFRNANSSSTLWV